MRKISRQLIQTSLNKAIIQTLSKQFPAVSSSLHIEDLVNALIGSLSRGEIYLDLNNKNKKPVEIKAKGWPNEHYQALLESGWLDNSNSPVILNNNLLSWRRWYVEMEDLIQLLKIRKIQEVSSSTTIKFEPSTQGHSKLNEEQLKAVEKAANKNLILISGGPGTGKTNTIAQILIQTLAKNPGLNVGLAAPTGKATRRLQESLQASIKNLEDNIKQKITEFPCQTLHKWLQVKDGVCRVNQSNPLKLDLLIVDEMSMVDLFMMKGLLKALQDHTQLILVGDPNQLPPVGSGSIWHQLHKQDIKKDFIEEKITLKKVYRNRGKLADLAQTIQLEGLETFWKQLENIPKGSNVSLHVGNKKNIPDFIIDHIKSQYKILKAHVSLLQENFYFKNKEKLQHEEENLNKVSEKIFNCVEELMILCPRKHGYWSVEHVNKVFLESDYEKNISSWPEGTPIICGANQPEIGLANGDIGITVGNGHSRYLLFRVVSEEKKLTAKFILPSRVKKIDAAFAITIHKAQGSEAKHVVLLWPDLIDRIPLINQEIHIDEKHQKSLIYTGITRAKEYLDIVLHQEVTA